MRLTDLSIKSLKSPPSGQRTYFDDNLQNFGVRVSQGGTKSFVVLLGRNRSRRTIGKYPIITLATARKEAHRLLGEHHHADTPLGISTITFSEAKERFLTDTANRTRERTIDEYRRHLNKHFPLKKRLKDVTRQDVMQAVERLGNVPSEQKHAFVAVRTMMNWCVRQGLLHASPVPKLSFKVDSRDRVLSDDELKEVWERAGAFGYPYGTIVKLLILTGQRRGEIGALRFDWIEEDRIVFPSSITKNGRIHHLPIAPQTHALIKGIPRTGDLLFPSRLDDTKPFNGWSKCKKRFDEGLSFQDYTLHDLRRTYASNLAKAGTPIHVTERILNHASGTVSGVAAVYNRYSYWEEMVEAVEALEVAVFNTHTDTR